MIQENIFTQALLLTRGRLVLPLGNATKGSFPLHSHLRGLALSLPSPSPCFLVFKTRLGYPCQLNNEGHYARPPRLEAESPCFPFFSSAVHLSVSGGCWCEHLPDIPMGMMACCSLVPRLTVVPPTPGARPEGLHSTTCDVWNVLPPPCYPVLSSWPHPLSLAFIEYTVTSIQMLHIIIFAAWPSCCIR